MESNRWFHHSEKKIEDETEEAYQIWRNRQRDPYHNKRFGEVASAKKEEIRRAIIREMNEIAMLERMTEGHLPPSHPTQNDASRQPE
ncbi:Hypothetical protein UVM_LOCUS234 [uncultured virus]|nr:Hypothetical protein UVM_LOCUS234 [uncultured virus]